MKKNLMNHAAGRMVLTFFLCCAMTTTVVNAQEAESPIKKGEHPAKAADDAPQDWKKQYNAAIKTRDRYLSYIIKTSAEVRM